MRRAVVDSPPRAADAPLFLSEAEVQAVASTDPKALKTLFLPDYDGVATSFARLLHRVQRCKWDGQVDGRVLHACEALGVCQGRFVATAVLAKRLRGFGLGWHSFTLEECEAFVEVELDADEDGRVTVEDIFAFLHNWQQQAQQARSRRPNALVGGRTSITETKRRWEARRQSGVSATRQFPRGLREKLLAAAGQARSRGVNVLKMLRVTSSWCLEGGGNGAEAACRFLRRIGVDFDSNAMARTSGGSAYFTRRKWTQELDATRETKHSRERVSLLRPRQDFPRDRSMYIPSSRQHGWGGCVHQYNLNGGGTVSCAERWPAGCEQSPTAGVQTLLDARTTSNMRDTTRRSLRGGSNPSDSPMLPSKSEWVVHGVGDSSYHHEGVNSVNEGAEGGNVVGEGRRTSSARKGSGIGGMSQRLRRAAEDLERMQTAYEELQIQAHGERPGSPRAPSGTTAQPTNDQTSGAVRRYSYNATKSSLYRGPSSFRSAHRNPRHDGTNYFERRQQPSPGFEAGARDHREKRETDEKRTEQCLPVPLLSSDKETLSSMDAARPRQHAAHINRYHRHTRSPANEVSSARVRVDDSLETGWPRHGPDTRRCRALLLLAAQGKSSRNESFDVATARNGFSGIQPCDLGDETKVCRTSKPRGRCRGARASNEHDVRRGQKCVGVRGAGAAAMMASNESFPRPCYKYASQGVHPFLASAGAERRNAGGYGVVAGGVSAEESPRRGRRDHTPDRRPIRPKAIKSPMYARRGRSEERNVWDRRSGRWARPRPRPGEFVRSRSVDHVAALERHRRRGGCGIVRY